MTPRPEQPATAAGRALLDFVWEHKFDNVRFDGPELRERILAIEREAAAAVLPDVAVERIHMMWTAGYLAGREDDRWLNHQEIAVRAGAFAKEQTE